MIKSGGPQGVQIGGKFIAGHLTCRRVQIIAFPDRLLFDLHLALFDGFQGDIAIFAYQTAVHKKFISHRSDSGDAGQVTIDRVQGMGKQVAGGRAGYVPVTLQAIEVGIQIVDPWIR